MNILYIEDDLDTSYFVSRTIKEYFNCNITTASNGKEAYELFCKNSFEIILLDIKLPDMNGFELIKKLKKLEDDFSVIVVSGYDDKEYLMESIKLNVSDFFVKPLNVKELVYSIENRINPKKIIKLDKDYSFDPQELQLFYKNTPVKMQKGEKLALKTFIENNNKVIDTYTIFDEIWGIEKEFNQTSIHTIIKKLRKKIPPQFIENIYGEGYRFCLNSY